MQVTHRSWGSPELSIRFPRKDDIVLSLVGAPVTHAKGASGRDRACPNVSGLPAADGRGSLQILHEFGKGHAECRRQRGQGVETRIAATALDSAHVRPVKSRPLREGLLGEAEGHPSIANTRSER